MDYRKYAIFSFVVFFILLGSFIIARQLTRAPEQTEIQEDKSLLSFPMQEIAALAVIHGENRFGLIHQPPQIRLEPPVEGEVLSQQELQAYILDISNLSYELRLQTTGVLDNYGLSTPQSQITVFLNSGEKVRFILGNRNKLNNGFYLKKENEESIYVISDTSSFLFFKRPDDFRDRRILPGITMDEIDLINEISLDFPNERRRSFKISNTGTLNFMLSQPLRNTLDFEEVLSRLILPLITTDAKQRFEEGELPEPPGALIARLSMKIEDVPTLLTLFEAEDGMRYLRRNEERGYFRIDSDQIPLEKIDYIDLLDGSIYHSNISELSSISIEDIESGRTYRLDITGQSVELTGMLDGQGIEYQDLMELFTLLVSTDIAGSLQAEDRPDQLPASTFELTFYRKDGKIDLLEYFPAEKGDLYLAVNGNINFTTYTKTILDIRRYLDSI